MLILDLWEISFTIKFDGYSKPSVSCNGNSEGMFKESSSYKTEKAVLGSILVLSGCAPKLPEVVLPSPEKNVGELVSITTKEDMPAIEKETLVDIPGLRREVVNRLTKKGVEESKAADAADTAILGFFGKGSDGSIRLIVNKEILGSGLSLRFERPDSILKRIGVSDAEFERSRVAFAQKMQQTWNVSVNIADASSQSVLVHTSGKGEGYGGSIESYYSSDSIGNRPIWNLHVKSFGVDYDYLYSHYIARAPFKTAEDRVKYWNSLSDMVMSHELGHGLSAEHNNVPLVLGDGNPSHPDVSLMASDINVSYNYYLSPGGSYVNEELVTNLIDPDIDPSIISTAFIQKSLKIN